MGRKRRKWEEGVEGREAIIMIDYVRKESIFIKGIKNKIK